MRKIIRVTLTVEHVDEYGVFSSTVRTAQLGQDVSSIEVDVFSDGNASIRSHSFNVFEYLAERATA